jgi:hypothetical protein
MLFSFQFKSSLTYLNCRLCHDVACTQECHPFLLSCGPSPPENNGHKMSQGATLLTERTDSKDIYSTIAIDRYRLNKAASGGRYGLIGPSPAEARGHRGRCGHHFVSNDIFVQQIKKKQKMNIYLEFFFRHRRCGHRSNMYVFVLNRRRSGV